MQYTYFKETALVTQYLSVRRINLLDEEGQTVAFWSGTIWQNLPQGLQVNLCCAPLVGLGPVGEAGTSLPSTVAENCCLGATP